MCGIAGEIVFDARVPEESWARDACQIMKHRGPDGDGIYRADGVALAHRRLAIIDLAGGCQPMPYADGRYTITFNGEIYNYRELRAELSALGYVFATSSDTEVILAAYAAWGVGSFPRLNGIFAFAIWDAAQQELILARDHLGIKPLLYHHDGAGLRFASELKPLLAHPAVKRETDPEAVQDYLTLGYVLAPKTIIRDVYKLPPAHYLRAGGGQVSLARYWNLADAAQSDDLYGRPEAEILGGFDDLLRATIGQQMVSDVPLGAFLSGGLDSSTICYHAADFTAEPLRSFSIGFDEASYSELDYAQQAADHIGTRHTQEVVRPEGGLAAVEALVWFYDEPLGDTSLIPTYYVSQLARQQVTVALSGDGGDELLAGYDTYVADRLQAWYARVPGWMQRGVVQPAAALLPSSYRKVSLDFKIKQFVAYAHQTPEAAHFSWRRMFSDAERAALAGANGAPSGTFERYAAHYDDVPRANPLNRSLYVDIKTWLVDDILSKVDRASMACSLEARVPFLAFPLVEYAMRMPPGLKMRGLERKVALKRLMKGRLPEGLIHRKKRGFNAPTTLWMRGDWREPVDDLLRQRASRIIDLGCPALLDLWRQHVSGQGDHGYKLWTLLSLLLWERQVLNAAPAVVGA